MKTVKLGGRILRVEDEIVPRYLAQGYSVIDSEGNVLEKGAIITLDQALMEIARLKDENRKLREELLAVSNPPAPEANAVPGTEDAASAPENDKGEHSFTCPHCGKAYKTESGLASHISREHCQE